MRMVKGGVTAAKGFWAGGIHCGIKFKKPDLALIYSPTPCVATGLFTQNKVRAASVRITQKHIRNNRAQAIIVNSGNANCCTGRQGERGAWEMANSTAKSLDLPADDVLVASTGIIGKRLPIEKIKKGIFILADNLSRAGGAQAARAIMTTDTKSKQAAVRIKLHNKVVTIGGMTKGAGMICPNMATMLAFITTDAAVDKKGLNQALHYAVTNSFNSITVEGDTSTNDMVVVLANGLAGNGKMSKKDLLLFQKALEFVCLALAKMIIKDAEGASKFIEITVSQAKTPGQAKKVALQVANSPLVKTALYGSNPNWGRIAAAVGVGDSQVQQERLAIFLGPHKVMSNGARIKAERNRIKKLCAKKEIRIGISLGLGRYQATIYTCDLSHQYVSINAEY